MTSQKNELQRIDVQKYIRGPWLCAEISADGRQAVYAIINNEGSLHRGECIAVVASRARNNTDWRDTRAEAADDAAASRYEILVRHDG